MNEYGCQAGSIYPGNEVECGFHVVTLHDFVPHTIFCRWAEGRGESQRSTWSERERESGKRESTHAINIAHNGRAILQRRLRSARDDGIRSDSALERQGEREEERRAGGPESERELPKVLPSFLPPSLACFVLPDCPLCYGPRSPRELQDPSDIIEGSSPFVAEHTPLLPRQDTNHLWDMLSYACIGM